MGASRRLRMTSVAALVVGVIPLGSPALATSPPADDSGRTSVGATTPKPTRITGFSATTERLPFGSVFRDSVRVRTGAGYVARPVTLVGRRYDRSGWGPWSLLRRDRTSADGRYAISFSRSGAWQLRVEAPATSAAEAATTADKPVKLAEPGCRSRMSSVAHGVPYTTCTAKVNGIKVFYFVPKNTPLGSVRAAKIAFYFHGDGEPSYWQDSTQFDYADQWTPMAWALHKGYVVAAPVAPKYGPGKQKWGASHAFTNATGRALRKFKRAVAASGAMYWSTSGGSVYLARSYIPFVGHLMPGPMALSCGADVPAFGWRWSPAKNRKARNQLDLLFNHGSRDFLASYTRAARTLYRAKGFDTKMRTWKGAGHCAHPIAGPTINWFRSH